MTFILRLHLFSQACVVCCRRNNLPTLVVVRRTEPCIVYGIEDRCWSLRFRGRARPSCRSSRATYYSRGASAGKTVAVKSVTVISAASSGVTAASPVVSTTTDRSSPRRSCTGYRRLRTLSQCATTVESPPSADADRGNSGNRQLVELQHRASVAIITTPPRPNHVRGNTVRLGEPPTPAQEGQNGVRVQVLQPDVQQTLFTAHTRAQPHAGGQLPVWDVL